MVLLFKERTTIRPVIFNRSQLLKMVTIIVISHFFYFPIEKEKIPVPVQCFSAAEKIFYNTYKRSVMKVKNYA